MSLPKKDPYEEIYTAKDVFYRLVNPEWIFPADQVRSGFRLDGWNNYLEQLSKAKTLHEYIRGYSFISTYQFYSAGISTHSFVRWTRNQPPDNLEDNPYYHLEHRGFYECFVDHMDHELP